jgi:hypothetical protein
MFFVLTETGADRKRGTSAQNKKKEPVLELKLEKGRLFLKAEDMPLNKIFATLAARYDIEIINGALLPNTPMTMMLENVSEKTGVKKLLQKAKNLNHLVAMRKTPVENKSIFAKIGFFPIEGGTGKAGDPQADYFKAQDYSTGSYEEGPHYIPPDEPPQYIPPDGEPQYIPPDEPPQYIPPDEPPQYIPPPDGEPMMPDESGGEQPPQETPE